MTAKEFVGEIEAYYGPYERDTTKGYVYQWAREVEYALDDLWPALMKNFSGQYGRAPDIAAIEKVAQLFDESVYNPWGAEGKKSWRIALWEQRELAGASRKELE